MVLIMYWVEVIELGGMIGGGGRIGMEVRELREKEGGVGRERRGCVTGR